MFKKLEDILKRFKELQNLSGEEGVSGNPVLYHKYAKEMARIRGLANKYENYQHIKKEIEDLKKEIDNKSHDNAFIELAKEEVDKLENKLRTLDKELEDELYEQDDADSVKNIIMEIRAGTGGVEAALFAGDLYRMYCRYSTKNNWNVETLSSSVTEKGGIKEIIFSIMVNNVYGRMKYESGAHRVQRVPATEASGRIHTSAATVAVLPEAEEVDVKINPQDIKIDVFRSSGRGGQHVNVTDSAVRITHLPTGLVVTCQDERSQYKNKAKAMRVLRTKLFEKADQEQRDKIAKKRKMQVGTGDRSEKIRTYNFPDRRVTDHRIGITLHRLEDVLNGDLDEIIDALKEEERKRRRSSK